MGTKRTTSEGAVTKAAKLPPKRKVAVRPKAVERAVEAAPVSIAPVTVAGTARVVGATEIAPELIALRAYFISEQRRAEGRDGDSLADWLEAERQLRTESAV
jgi:hypothetical protein